RLAPPARHVPLTLKPPAFPVYAVKAAFSPTATLSKPNSTTRSYTANVLAGWQKSLFPRGLTLQGNFLLTPIPACFDRLAFLTVCLRPFWEQPAGVEPWSGCSKEETRTDSIGWQPKVRSMIGRTSLWVRIRRAVQLSKARVLLADDHP